MTRASTKKNAFDTRDSLWPLAGLALGVLILRRRRRGDSPRRSEISTRDVQRALQSLGFTSQVDDGRRFRRFPELARFALVLPVPPRQEGFAEFRVEVHATRQAAEAAAPQVALDQRPDEHGVYWSESEPFAKLPRSFTAVKNYRNANLIWFAREQRLDRYWHRLDDLLTRLAGS